MGKGGMRWGAGRPSYRAKAEQLQRVDIRAWHRRGYLSPGRSFTWSWRMGDEPVGSINVLIEDPHLLRLRYMVGDGDDRRDGSQAIRLAYTPCHFGGGRPWLTCPQCQRRAGLLYMRWGRFACRLCQRVAYASQSDDLVGAAWRRQARIEARLGENWQRPKGMRRQTYERLLAALSDCESQRDWALVRAIERLGWRV